MGEKRTTKEREREMYEREHYGPVIERIRQTLEDKGMSQKEFGVKMGWSEAVVSKLMCGKRKIWAEEIKPLCNALGVSVSFLFDGEGA